MNHNQASITTARLTLRRLRPEDANTLHLINQSEGVLQYFPNPVSPALEKVQGFIVGQETHWQEFGYGNWGVELKDEHELIGWAGLQYLPELDETEVGFLLDRPYWGKGYATEAARACLQFGFNQLGLEHIIALVHPGNMASRRVIEKCEMKYQDTIHLWGIKLMRFRMDHPAIF
jgi:[ribosomal protein S5]-alanine N-acetyltransferase